MTGGVTPLFFYGTLRHAPLLEAVVGRLPEMEPARLSDHAPYEIEGEFFPALYAAPGQIADGVLVTGLSEAELARIDFYEGPGDYTPMVLSAETANGPVQAQVYFSNDSGPPKTAPWSYERWIEHHADLSVETAHEAMTLADVLSTEEFDEAYPMMISRAQARLRARSEPAPSEVRGEFERADIEIVAERRPYTKYFAVSEQDIRFPQFTGGMGPKVTRAAFIGGDAVTLLPYDPVRDRVLLIEQFRFGPHVRHDPKPWLLEPIAGRIDPGEDPEMTARREAVEEARIELGELHHIARYYPSPGTLAEFLISYVGIADLPDEAAVVAGVEGEAEDIKGHLLPFERLMHLVETGEAANAPLILSAQWIALNRERLRAAS